MYRLWMLLIFLAPLRLFGQLETQMDPGGYIQKMNNTLNLRFDLDNDVRFFEFKTSDDTYSILPNNRLRTVIGYNYRFLSFRVGFSPKFLASGDSDEKGNTSIFRLTLDMFIEDIYQTLDYSRVKGYYVSGFDGVGPLPPQPVDEFIILPNMKTVSITGSTYYRFNNNYSFKAVVNQTEIQSKSAGSFVPGLQYGYWLIENDQRTQDLQSIYITASGGYFHTFVLSRSLYANMGISAGFGVEFNKIDTRINDDEVTDRNTTGLFNLNTQIGLGYNSKRFYAGTALKGNAFTRQDNSIIYFDNVRSYFEIYVGYRFDPPRFLIEAMDWAEDRNPFSKKNR